MTKTLLFILISILTVLNSLQSQTKYEREYRIKSEQVPEPALNFIKELPFSEKIKWYKEEGIDKESVEAKTKHLSKKYSVEFSTDGSIEDIEIEIKAEEIPSAVHDAIFKYFNTTYQKVKICKVQIQFSGDPDLLIQTVQEADFFGEKKVPTHYEIVVKAKGKEKVEQLEYLFDDQGKMVDKAVIILKNTDNLEY